MNIQKFYIFFHFSPPPTHTHTFKKMAMIVSTGPLGAVAKPACPFIALEIYLIFVFNLQIFACKFKKNGMKKMYKIN